jgi:hypothetical protein
MEFPLRLLLLRFPRFWRSVVVVVFGSSDAVLESLSVLVLVLVLVDVLFFVTGFRCHRVKGVLTTSPMWWGGCFGFSWSSEVARVRRDVRFLFISLRISEMPLLPFGVSLTFLCWRGEGLVSSGVNDGRLRKEELPAGESSL